MALAAQKDPIAHKEATALAEQWLAPADSAVATNQVLPRKQILSAIDAATALGQDAALEAVRAKVIAAPGPDVFVPEAGDFF